MIELKILQAENQQDLESFNRFMEEGFKHYARERALCDLIDYDQACLKAQKQKDELLPEGIQTPHHYFFHIVLKESFDSPVGHCWLYFEAGETEAYLYDFEIYEKFRGQGYGKVSFELIKSQAKNLGARTLGLNVFSHNTRALELYKKHGMRVSSLYMNTFL